MKFCCKNLSSKAYIYTANVFAFDILTDCNNFLINTLQYLTTHRSILINTVHQFQWLGNLTDLKADCKYKRWISFFKIHDGTCMNCNAFCRHTSYEMPTHVLHKVSWCEAPQSIPTCIFKIKIHFLNERLTYQNCNLVCINRNLAQTYVVEVFR